MGEKQLLYYISYEDSDVKWAEWISYLLCNKGHKTFVRAYHTLPGDNLIKNDDISLKEADCFIAVVSQKYLYSDYEKAKWTAFYKRSSNSEKRDFFIVRIEDVYIGGILAPLVSIDIYDMDEERAVQSLLTGLNETDIPINQPFYPGVIKVRFPGSLPIQNLPYIRNTNFTGRTELLRQIHSRFHIEEKKQLIQLISGLGGIGKTQLALEYAYRYASEYDYIWWIHAETEETVLNSYNQIAKKLLLLKSEDDNQYLVDIVLNWLDTHQNWLLIYDNLESLSTNTYWFPKNNRENILITTRDWQNSIGFRIKLSDFSPEEACSFLIKRTQQENPSEDTKAIIFQLSENLGYLPLALEIAAAFININECDFIYYSKLLKKYRFKLLEQMKGVSNYSISIPLTMKISIDKITSKPAQQLLKLCSYLASENIYPELFINRQEILPDSLKKIFSSELKQISLWQKLTQYSLLTKQDNQNYEMHKLLQEVVRNEIGKDQQWSHRVLLMLEQEFRFDYEHQEKFLIDSAHVDIFTGIIKKSLKDDKNQLQIASLYFSGGFGFYQLGSYFVALKWYQKVLTIIKEVLGDKHRYTATTYGNIGTVYSKIGNGIEALKWYHKVLDIQKNLPEDIHHDIAITYNNIGLIYYEQRNIDESLRLYFKALVIQETESEVEHPDTAITYGNIGAVYSDKGNEIEALKWYRKALDIQETVLGDMHLDTALTYNKIGTVYADNGNEDEALKWYHKALEIRESLLGVEHPDTASTYNNIGTIYSDKDNGTEALKWYHKALKSEKSIIKHNHSEIVKFYNNIGKVYIEQNDWDKALESCNKALVISKSVLGNNHSLTAITYHNIAEVYNAQGNQNEAMECYRKAFDIRENVLGNKHSDTATTCHHIAQLYYEQRNKNEALKWYHKTLGILEALPGNKDLEIAIICNNIALIHFKQGNNSKALKWFRKALNLRKNVLKGKHPDNAKTHNNIAEVYREKGNEDKALEHYHKALDILGDKHPDTAMIYGNIAVIYYKQGNETNALKFLHKLILIHGKGPETKNLEMAELLNILAMLHINQGNKSEALKWFHKALDIQKTILGEKHPDTQKTYFLIKSIT